MFKEDIYFCPYCGIKTNNNICCEICSNELKKFVNKNIGSTEFCDAFTAPFVYDDIVRDAVHNFKFEKRRNYCESFGYFMASCDLFYSDIIISVPSFDNKKKYNTSDLLAKYMSKLLNIRYQRHAVSKIRNTKFQHECDFSKRLSNLNDCFSASPKKLNNLNILICDDIITSGSTIDEVAKACKKSGARNVYAVAFAVSNGAFADCYSGGKNWDVKF